MGRPLTDSLTSTLPGLPNSTTLSTVTGAEIEIESPSNIKVDRLDVGAEYLYRNKTKTSDNQDWHIQTVSSELQGWQFTACRLRQNISYTIHVSKAGIIYAFDGVLPDGAEGWEEDDDVITAKWISHCYRRSVQPGDTINIEGEELHIAAATISISPARPAITSTTLPTTVFSSVSPPAARATPVDMSVPNDVPTQFKLRLRLMSAIANTKWDGVYPTRITFRGEGIGTSPGATFEWAAIDKNEIIVLISKVSNGRVNVDRLTFSDDFETVKKMHIATTTPDMLSAGEEGITEEIGLEGRKKRIPDDVPAPFKARLQLMAAIADTKWESIYPEVLRINGDGTAERVGQRGEVVQKCEWAVLNGSEIVLLLPGGNVARLAFSEDLRSVQKKHIAGIVPDMDPARSEGTRVSP